MKTILIVEDNELNLKLLLRILDSNGYETLSAQGGEVSIEMAKTHVPDLVLMDLQMPGVDGYAALERLREEAYTSTIPVVAVTGNALQHDREKILSSGFDGYIIKPYKIDELLATVGAFLPH